MSLFSITSQPFPGSQALNQGDRTVLTTLTSTSTVIPAAPKNGDPILQIQACERDEDRILLAADLAYSRSLGRHLGDEILILYRAWDSNGDYTPADAALAWLKIHGSRSGIYLRER